MGIIKRDIAVCTAVAAVAVFFILAAPVQAQANTTPPASISDLNETAVGDTWINWTWTNPSDVNFSLVMVYDVEGVLKTNVSGVSGNMSYLNTSSIEPFEANTTYTICTHTVDTEGNINTTWVNDSATTLPSPEVTPEAEVIPEVEAPTETEAEVVPEVAETLEAEAEVTPAVEAPTEAEEVAPPEATPEAEAPPKTPGFETIFAITSLLAVTYLVRIRK